MILPYTLAYDSLGGTLKRTKEGSTYLVLSLVGIAFVVGVNVLMYFIYKRTRKKSNKEINKKKYWLVNIVVHFIPLIVALMIFFLILL